MRPGLLNNGIDGPDHFGGLGFRCKIEHQHTAAGGQMFLINTTESLLAFLPHMYQPGFSQNGAMVRDGRLGHVQLLDNFIDR
jgi:hypothetical protein